MTIEKSGKGKPMALRPKKPKYSDSQIKFARGIAEQAGQIERMKRLVARAQAGDKIAERKLLNLSSRPWEKQNSPLPPSPPEKENP
jgi:hypothetical protein